MSFQIPIGSPMIYESPDGGNTIYVRKSNSTERELVYKNHVSLFRDRLNLWRDILTEAERNSALEDMVNQTEMLYKLVKDK